MKAITAGLFIGGAATVLIALMHTKGGPVAHRPPLVVQQSSRPMPPPTLRHLCRMSDTIVVGSVTRVVREGHNPIGSSSPILHTVYGVAVDRYLHSDGAPTKPAELKVFQIGQVGRYMDAGNPLLNVGDRYILFLRSVNTPLNRRFGGALTRIGNVQGVSSYLDEYLVSEPTMGKIAIRAGITAVPEDPQQANLRPWSFAADPAGNLLGLWEEEAVHRIQVGVEASKVPG